MKKLFLIFVLSSLLFLSGCLVGKGPDHNISLITGQFFSNEIKYDIHGIEQKLQINLSLNTIIKEEYDLLETNKIRDYMDKNQYYSIQLTAKVNENQNNFSLKYTGRVGNRNNSFNFVQDNNLFGKNIGLVAISENSNINYFELHLNILNAGAFKVCLYLWTEQINEMKQAYLETFLIKDDGNATLENVIWEQYLGSYHEAYIVLWKIEELDKESSITIDDFILNFKSEYQILVWYNHHFYFIQEAYEENLLTLSNISLSLSQISSSFQNS